MNTHEVLMESIGWLSTATFLYSIVHPNRMRLHEWGIFTSVTTGLYAFHHGATAIWVKWVLALFFHLFMWLRLRAVRDGRPSLTRVMTGLESEGHSNSAADRLLAAAREEPRTQDQTAALA